jgi:hypothetical protein
LVVADDVSGLKMWKMTGWYNVGCLVLLGWTLCFAVHGLGNGLFCGNHSFAGWGRGKPFGGVGQTCALVFRWITFNIEKNFSVEKKHILPNSVG